MSVLGSHARNRVSPSIRSIIIGYSSPLKTLISHNCVVTCREQGKPPCRLNPFGWFTFPASSRKFACSRGRSPTPTNCRGFRSRKTAAPLKQEARDRGCEAWGSTCNPLRRPPFG